MNTSHNPIYIFILIIHTQILLGLIISIFYKMVSEEWFLLRMPFEVLYGWVHCFHIKKNLSLKGNK